MSLLVNKKNVLKNLLIGFVLFSVLSGSWIFLISMKYNRVTFSTMGRGVFSVYAPGTSHETLEKGDPIFYEGFFEPPNETAHIIYEDPSFARGTTWSPLASKRSFQHFFRIFLKNIVEGIRIVDSFSRLSIVILIIYIVLLFVHPGRELFKNRC
jgi:hypothetical protein